MEINLIGIILGVGAAFLLVGILRGGIKISTITIPPIPTATSAVLIVLGLSFVIVAIYLMVFTNPPNPSQALDTAQKQALDEIRSELSVMDARLKSVESSLDALSQSPDQNAMSLQLGELQGNVKQIEVQVTALEEVILDDPNKAVALPLLQKDMDTLKEVSDSKIQAVQQSVSQVYNLLISVIVVLGLGFLGIAATNFLAPKKPED